MLCRSDLQPEDFLTMGKERKCSVGLLRNGYCGRVVTRIADIPTLLEGPGLARCSNSYTLQGLPGSTHSRSENNVAGPADPSSTDHLGLHNSNTPTPSGTFWGARYRAEVSLMRRQCGEPERRVVRTQKQSRPGHQFVCLVCS